MPEKVEEKFDGVVLCFKMMDNHLTPCPDATPSACERSLPEQVWLYRHRVKASHVLCPVGSFDIKLVALSDHVGMIALRGFAVQRVF